MHFCFYGFLFFMVLFFIFYGFLIFMRVKLEIFYIQDLSLTGVFNSSFPASLVGYYFDDEQEEEGHQRQQ